MTSNHSEQTPQEQGASRFKTPNPQELKRDVQNHSAEERAGQTQEAGLMDADEAIHNEEDDTSGDGSTLIGNDRIDLMNRQIGIANIGGQ